MSDKPKRRWYQFSLWTMLIAVTLVTLPLGRVAYLRQIADYHANEHNRLTRQIAAEWNVPEDSLASVKEILRRCKNRRDLVTSGGMSFLTKTNNGVTQEFTIDSEWNTVFEHERLSGVYQQAVYRPWAFVDETPK